MPSSTTKAIFSLLGWSYIPDFITSTLLRWAGPYFRTPITPLHYRLTFAFVVLSYLIYNFLKRRSPHHSIFTSYSTFLLPPMGVKSRQHSAHLRVDITQTVLVPREVIYLWPFVRDMKP